MAVDGSAKTISAKRGTRFSGPVDNQFGQNVIIVAPPDDRSTPVFIPLEDLLEFADQADQAEIERQEFGFVPPRPLSERTKLLAQMAAMILTGTWTESVGYPEDALPIAITGARALLEAIEQGQG